MSKLAGIFEPLPAGLDVVAENGKTMSVVVTYLDGAAVDAALAEVGAKTVTLPELQHSVAGELAALDAQEHALAAEKEALNQQGLETSALRTALTIRREWAEAGRKLGEAQGRLAATNSVFVLLGWVRERDQEKLVKGMGPFGNAVSLELSDPGPEDNPPISLQNGPFVKPFEAVTTIFGLPHYGEPDPTPLLAPFFLVFFGFAFGDALYGVLLILFSLWLIKRYHLEGSGKSFMTLMIYLGVSTIVMGAILGGWFGDLFRYFPPWLGFLERFRQSLMLVDPISAPLTVFVITLVFGLIQVWTGIFIKFRNRVRNGEFWASFWLEGGWLLFFSGGAVAVVQAAGYMTSLPKIVGLAWALGGAAVIVLGAAMRTSNWFMKIPAGLYGFYPVVGYLADMLSYSRLLALGLAGGVVATVMNQLASMVNFAPVIGPILMAVIVLGGQIFNFMINILGAFIHSARLQFIEYFSKFFEGGGRPFRPLSIEHAHTFAKE
jgi:V/A-type H+-transporting ATPase subunit I